MEKLTIMFIITLTSMMATTAGDVTIASNSEGQLIMACVFGAIISAFISFRKARKAKSDKEEAFSAVIIALMSGVLIGYVGAPPISSMDKLVNLTRIEPLTGALLALAAAQIVEFITAGHLGDFIKQIANKKLGAGDSSHD